MFSVFFIPIEFDLAGQNTNNVSQRIYAPVGLPVKITLLHVGSTIPRKRIDVLLAVFAAVRQRIPEARLVRAGGQFTEEQAGFDLPGNTAHYDIAAFVSTTA
jgi:glycosyltransferase involved in cell wall biosynthesis